MSSICLPLGFILNTCETVRNSMSPAQEWDALGCTSRHTLVLSDITSSHQAWVLQAAPPLLLIAKPLYVGTHTSLPAHLDLGLRSSFHMANPPLHFGCCIFFKNTFFLRRTCLYLCRLPNAVGAHINLAHRKVKNLRKFLVRKNAYPF